MKDGGSPSKNTKQTAKLLPMNIQSWLGNTHKTLQQKVFLPDINLEGLNLFLGFLLPNKKKVQTMYHFCLASVSNTIPTRRSEDIGSKATKWEKVHES